MHDYTQYMSERKEQALVMRRALHLFLLGKGVSQITVTYSGSGDSGGFDDFNYEGGSEAIEDELVEIEDGKGGTKTESLRQVLEVTLDRLLDSEHAGWENNDGAEGTFTWDIATNELKLEHTEFYTESNTHEHEF